MSYLVPNLKYDDGEWEMIGDDGVEAIKRLCHHYGLAVKMRGP